MIYRKRPVSAKKSWDLDFEDGDVALYATHQRVRRKVENLAHAVSLHFMHYDFARPHTTLEERYRALPRWLLASLTTFGPWKRSRRRWIDPLGCSLQWMIFLQNERYISCVETFSTNEEENR